VLLGRYVLLPMVAALVNHMQITGRSRTPNGVSDTPYDLQIHRQARVRPAQASIIYGERASCRRQCARCDRGTSPAKIFRVLARDNDRLD
jgi:hypothetical protein